MNSLTKFLFFLVVLLAVATGVLFYKLSFKPPEPTSFTSSGISIAGFAMQSYMIQMQTDSTNPSLRRLANEMRMLDKSLRDSVAYEKKEAPPKYRLMDMECCNCNPPDGGCCFCSPTDSLFNMMAHNNIEALELVGPNETIKASVEKEDGYNVFKLGPKLPDGVYNLIIRGNFKPGEATLELESKGGQLGMKRASAPIMKK